MSVTSLNRISTRGQLPLDTVEQIAYFQGCEAAAMASGVTPTLDKDPDQSDRIVAQLKITGTIFNSKSTVTYELQDDQVDVWLECELRFTHPNLGSVTSPGRLRLIDFVAENGDVALRLAQLQDGSTALLDNNGDIIDTFSDSLAKDQWHIVRLHYKAFTFSEQGEIEAWLYDAVEQEYVLQVHENTEHTLQVRQLILKSDAFGSILSASGDKTTWFRGLTWGTQESHVGFKNRGLQFGHVCSPEDSPEEINARLWYRFPRGYHGNDLSDVEVQFQYRPTLTTEWIDSDDPEELVEDSFGEMIVAHTVKGLDPLTGYQFRAVVTGGGEFNPFSITTEIISCVTPTAADGEPGQLRYVFGSCEKQDDEAETIKSSPKTFMTTIKELAPHGFIHLGDMTYADIDPPFGDQEHIRESYRINLVWDYDQNSLHESAAFFPMWDDHECGRDNAEGANPEHAGYFGVSNPVAEAYWVSRRINAIGDAKGWSFDTAKCHFIMMDMRSNKNTNTEEGAPAVTMLGGAQYENVKELLSDTGKPINFLFSPGPVVVGHSPASSADGWNEFVEDRDGLFEAFHQNNPSGSILIICSGDRHFVYVATDWENDYGGRIKPEWCSSPLVHIQRSPNNLGSPTTVIYKEDVNHVTINRFAVIDIDEEELTVTIGLYDGGPEAGLMFEDTYTAEE
jgi:hypothetical protein